jgi:hypothetical protein
MSQEKTYTLGSTRCDCHPETCCCSDYTIYENGKEYAQIVSKEIGDHIVEALNFFEKKGQLEGRLK